jgi:hypothetical protein
VNYYGLRELGAIKFYIPELGMIMLPQSSRDARNLFLSSQISVNEVYGIAQLQLVPRDRSSLVSSQSFPRNLAGRGWIKQWQYLP